MTWGGHCAHSFDDLQWFVTLPNQLMCTLLYTHSGTSTNQGTSLSIKPFPLWETLESLLRLTSWKKTPYSHSTRHRPKPWIYLNSAMSLPPVDSLSPHDSPSECWETHLSLAQTTALNPPPPPPGQGPPVTSSACRRPRSTAGLSFLDVALTPTHTPCCAMI